MLWKRREQCAQSRMRGDRCREGGGGGTGKAVRGGRAEGGESREAAGLFTWTRGDGEAYRVHCPGTGADLSLLTDEGFGDSSEGRRTGTPSSSPRWSGHWAGWRCAGLGLADGGLDDAPTAARSARN